MRNALRRTFFLYTPAPHRKLQRDRPYSPTRSPSERRCLSENVVLEVLPEIYFALILRAFMPIQRIARLSN